MKCKTFDRFLREMNQAPQKLNQWLEDKRLTQLEKKIILGHSYIRNNQNQKVIEELSIIPDSEIEFVNAHKYLLLGIASNNLSHFKEAQQYLASATESMETLELHYYSFVSTFNQFMLFSNLRNHNGMKDVITKMRLIPLETKMQELRLLRCEFIYADETDQNELAFKHLKEIHRFKIDMVESDLISHLVAEFMFYIKLENFELAKATLTSMKAHRKFQLSENYNFMKKLLDHYMENAPIYAYDEDFKKTPMLLYQLKVIQALESRELDEAQKYWNELQNIMPSVYVNNFEYKDTKCLFSLCLEKHKIKKVKTASVTKSDDQYKIPKLIALLKSSNVPLSKGHLFELLWGEPPQDKEELQRLTRLVYKARQSGQLDIQSRKGTYFIASPAKKKAV